MGKFTDLTGQRFGRLTVIERAVDYVPAKGYGVAQWRCVCDCGKESIIRGAHLKSGKTKSCGCLKGSPNDLVGHRFGRLVVIDRAENYISPAGKKRSRWRCQCDCGKITIVSGTDLKKEHVQSCGCLNEELKAQRKTTHGGSHTRLYRIWRGMLGRCNNSKSTSYKNYGGRGITVCEAWSNDFTAFQNWAFSNGYQDDLSIDRIDVNGNYSPENCRWATATEQARNNRRNRHITINGETKVYAEWCEQKGIRMSVVEKRLKKGWSIEEALNTPVGKKKTE